MGTATVRKRIFVSNALMILVTLVIFFTINLVVVRYYFESVEQELETSLMSAKGEEDLKKVIEKFTLRKNEFVLLFLADGILCGGVFVAVSQLFTRNLAGHIMRPLNALEEGAQRIRSQDLTRDIVYEGDLEFENVCRSFNEMRRAILAEQEKNRRYEKARTEMIAGISHDLRTPLTAIRGAIKGLLDGVADTPELRNRFLETAYRRTGDMDGLLNQLFYLSKLETGNLPVKLQPVRLPDFIRDYGEEKRELLKNEPVEITTDVPEAFPEILLDPQQLWRIFDNLLENSRKYAETVPLKISISLILGNGISIRFSDNGVGVPQEALSSIFEEFYRVDESRNKKEGSGLGLYIVRYLTKAMGGTVRAENEGGLAVYLEWKEKGEDPLCQTKSE